MRRPPEPPCASCGAPLEIGDGDHCMACAHTRPDLFARRLEYAAQAFALADRMEHDFYPSDGLLDELAWWPEARLPARTHAEWLAHMEARFERIAAVGVRVLGPAVDDEAEVEEAEMKLEEELAPHREIGPVRLWHLSETATAVLYVTATPAEEDGQQVSSRLRGGEMYTVLDVW